MAGGTGGEKMIGKLSIDISDIQVKIKQVDDWLGKIGANINLEDKLSKKISSALQKLVDEAKKAGEETQKALAASTSDKSMGDTEGLKQAIALWKEYYQLRTKEQTAINSGRSNQAAFYHQEAEAIKAKAAALKEESVVEQELEKVKRAYNAAVQAGADKQAAADVREHAKAEKELADEIQKRQKLQERREDINVRDQQTAYESLVRLYRELNDLDAKATKAVSSGNVANANLYTAREAEIQSLINSINQAYPEIDQFGKTLDDWAKADERVAEAEMKREAATNSAKQKAENLDYKDRVDAINKYATALESLYNAQTKLNQDLASGKITNGTAAYDDQINRIEQLKVTAEQAGSVLSADSRRQAEDMDRVTAAVQGATDSYGLLRDAQARSMADYNAETINQYANALETLYNAQAKLNQDVSSGKIREGSEEYEAAREKIKHFEEAVISAGEKIDAAGIKTANSMQNVKTAVDNLMQSEARLNDSGQINYLERTQNAYNQLSTAIRNYGIANKAKNEAGMNYWQEQINGAMSVINSIEKEIDSLNVDAETRQRILILIEQAKTAQNGFNAGVANGVTLSGDLSNQLSGMLMRMFSIMAAIRAISNLIKNTVEYVSEYYDKMNEIQMITLKTDEEVAELAETYRNLADMMNVSSLDMADAAIYFTRQGLGAAEIESRLKNVTMYAKTANVEFKEASEIITAVVNSMGLVAQEAEDGRDAAQRVADVFLKVGDSAATSGQEIGQAMQKAAASAGAFGMSFEWLASYIATVSETTRQEARTIGTALNTIIARLHQIKQNGYNSDDETKINDVQKALAKIGVTLMDNNNEWRDMDTIFQEIGDKWGTLDGKTKSYIATTMAGVKQQNVFLALMNDLGKGIEGGSRTWELYEKAMASAGTAEEKYAVYKDSVAASQERLNLAQEKFYSLLNADVIKKWNNAMAGFVNAITEGTKAMGNLNIVLPIAIGLITAVGLVITNLSTLWASHPLVMAIAGITLAVTALTAAVGFIKGAITTSAEAFDQANKSIEEHTQKLKSLRSLQDTTAQTFAEFGDATDLTAEELKNNNELLEKLCEVSPRAKIVVGQLREGLIDQKDAAAALNEELERQIENEQKLNLIAGIKKYSNYQNSDNIKNIQDMLKWGKSKGYGEGDNYFTEWLKTGLETQGIHTYDPHLTASLEKRVNKLKAELRDSGLNEEEKWGIIGQTIWYELFGTYDMSKNPLETMEDLAQEEIQNVMDIIEKDLEDPVYQFSARKYLTDLIFGDDGELSAEEYDSMGAKLSKFLSNYMNQGLQAIQIEPEDLLSYIGEDMFGVFFEDLFDPAKIAEVANNPELVRGIASAYSELLEAGFSKEQELFPLYKELDLSDWDKAVEEMKLRVRQDIREIGQTELNVWEDVLGDDNETVVERLYDNLMWDELDISTLKLIRDMVEFGVSVEDVKDLMAESSDVDEFKEKLQQLGESAGYVPGQLEETRRSISDLVKEIKASKKEIESINDLIKSINNGDPIDFEDILDLSQSHPEILACVGDLDLLKKKLEEIKRESVSGLFGDVQDMILDDETVFANSPFKDLVPEGMEEDIKTIREYQETLRLGSQEFNDVTKYVNEASINLLAATDQLKNVDKQSLLEWQELLFQSGSKVDLANRPVIDAKKLTAAGWGEAGTGIATLFSSTMSAGNRTGEDQADFVWHQNVVVDFTPILPDGTVMTPEDTEHYLEDLFSRSSSVEELYANDTKGIVISVTSVLDDETFETAMDNEGKRMELLHELQEAIYGVNEAEKTWLETMVEEAALNEDLDWAKSNGYIEQIGALSRTLESEGLENAIALWDTYDEKLQKSIAETYPDLASAILESKKALDDESNSADRATAANTKLGNALKKSASFANPKYFTSTYEAIKKLQAGTISATAAYDTWNKELDTVKKASEDIIDVNSKMAQKTEVTVSDVSNLAKVLGISAEQILADWPAAVAMFDELTAQGGELASVFDMLNEAAFIRITGTSEADFSAIKDGLISVQNLAQETIDLLVATGQWQVETKYLDTEAWVFENDQWVKKYMSGYQQILVPTNRNPFKGRSGGTDTTSTKKNKGGGGGGGGSNKKSTANQKSEVELMLDMMSQVKAIQDYQRNYYQAQQNYYAQGGYIQGVIGYMKLEQSVLEESNKTIEDNIAKIKAQMEAKQQEIAAMSTSDEQYESVADDLDKLQKAHQSYTLELIENQTAVDALTKSIKEQQDKIRQMEIDLRNLILSAIEDREAKRKNMLSNEIEMENTIFEIIKKRYEKERDQIIQTNNLRIESLQREKDLLSEQLQIRKEQAELEDKQAQLAKLELQYQRISADPTRQKEALEIQKKIKSLREELAWETAEQEVEAQQKSIDQQIESLEDYIEYIESYYEDLFEHPQKLIAEMREIMKRTDEEIIAWLKQNDENYQNSSDNTRKQIEEGWNDTLREMRGKLKLYWDEVESIIEKGDDYIIEFLKNNSADYAKAGRLQAEAYVDEWKSKLEDLRKAHQEVATSIASTYSTISPSTYTGDDNSGKSSGGGGTKKSKYKFVYNGTEYKGYTSYESANKAINKLAKTERDQNDKNYPYAGTQYEYWNSVIGQREKSAIQTIAAYARGGYVYSTGPAWLDGSRENPEAVLNPYQTKLFESMIKSLEQMSRIQVPSMPSFEGMDFGGENISVGDIIVNVDNLDTDDDYETLAQKVSDILMERIGRTTVVGGLRINSY